MKNHKIFLLTTIFLVFIIAFSITKTVKSQDSNNKDEERYCDMLEIEYMKSLKLILVENGYYNSGITMTKVIDDINYRKYKVVIHNKNILKLSKNNQEILTGKLRSIVFGDSNSIFQHEFLDFNQ